MLIPKDKLHDIYDHIKHKVLAAEGSVLICVAGETDAIAACHIFMTMLQADNIAYSMSAVRGMNDIVEKVDEVDKETCHTVVLFNCGASEDLLDRLRLDPNSDDYDLEREHMQVLVMDSHRPFHLYNVYGDGEDANGEFVDVGDIEKARVLLIHDPDMDDDIPDKETMMDANLDEEDQEEEEEEDLDESPVQRRRVGEDGESVAVAGGEEDDREERRKQREIREQARSTVAEYYNATSRGPATAMVLMEVSSKVRRVNQLDSATLWWAILGVTEQYINDDLDEHLYDKWLQTLTDEAIALNSRSSRELGRSEIVQYDEFRFYLLEHWNLYDSMKYSTYIGAKLELWKPSAATNSSLDTLLAKAGIPLIQAKEKYMHMKTVIKDRLEARLRASDDLIQEFCLEKLDFPTFRKQRKIGTSISATQCTHICNAMMCLPPRGDEQWSDAFQRASDAIWMSANREQAWDDLLNEKGAHNVVQGAISLRKQIVGKAFEISRDKSYQKLQDFTASCFVAGRDQQCLLHPAALSKLAFFVLEIDRKKYEDRRRVKGDNKALPASHSRWVLGVENEEDKSVLVVGVHASSELGYKERNRFGRLFQDAIQNGIPEVQVESVVQGFESNVLRITHGKFSDFVEYLNNEFTSPHAI